MTRKITSKRRSSPSTWAIKATPRSKRGRPAGPIKKSIMHKYLRRDWPRK